MTRYLLVVAFLAAPWSTTAAQDLLDAGGCRDCAIRSAHLLTIPSQARDSTLGSPESITVGPGSLYYIVSSETPGEIHVYDTRGRHVQTVGRAGDGPGEFRYIRFLAGTPDSLWVADQGNSRLTVLGPDLAVARTENLPARPIHFAPLPGGEILLNASIRTPGLVDLPLHRVRDGTIIQSFGYTGGAVRFDQSPYRGWRRIALAEQSIWGLHVDRYVVEEWTFDGRPLRSFRRATDWFPAPAGPLRGYSPESKPPSSSRGVQVMAPGILLAAFSVARNDFAAGLRRRQNTEHGTYVIDRIDRVFETVLEAIDVRLGAIVASERLEGFPLGFAQPGVIALLHSRDDGSYSIELRELQLTGWTR